MDFQNEKISDLKEGEMSKKHIGYIRKGNGLVQEPPKETWWSRYGHLYKWTEEDQKNLDRLEKENKTRIQKRRKKKK